MDLRYTYSEKPYLSMGYEEYLDKKDYFDENPNVFWRCNASLHKL